MASEFILIDSSTVCLYSDKKLIGWMPASRAQILSLSHRRMCIKYKETTILHLWSPVRVTWKNLCSCYTDAQ